jgi:hypothetical protein
MEYDTSKVDEAVLALLYINFFSHQGAIRAWKGFDWNSLDRLYDKGYISDPMSKAKSVIVTQEGQAAAEELFNRYFAA